MKKVSATNMMIQCSKHLYKLLFIPLIVKHGNVILTSFWADYYRKMERSGRVPCIPPCVVAAGNSAKIVKSYTKVNL